MYSVIDLEEKIRSIEKPWSPIDLIYINDQVIRAAVFEGEYHWHKHEEEDELFYVHRGAIRIEIKDRDSIELGEGQLTIIPKGVEHKPSSRNPSVVLLFEPIKLKSRGD